MRGGQIFPYQNTFNKYIANTKALSKEKTELYISYPIKSDCESEFIYEMNNYSENDEYAYTCLNENGENYDVYKIKCEPFFTIMKKSKTEAFDNNYLSNQNRTIYITNYYISAFFCQRFFTRL